MRSPWTPLLWTIWVQIIMGIEEEFDIEIPSEEAEKIVTVGDAVEQIKNAVN